jgi:hypothetical protein
VHVKGHRVPYVYPFREHPPSRPAPVAPPSRFTAEKAYVFLCDPSRVAVVGETRAECRAAQQTLAFSGDDTSVVLFGTLAELRTVFESSPLSVAAAVAAWDAAQRA